jgi:flagellar protein FliJ
MRGVGVALELAERRRDVAGRALAHAVHACQAAREQLAQLQAYADETRNRWALGARAWATPELMRHYQSFMDRLQQAVDLQQAAVEQHESARTAAQADLLQLEIRIASLNKLRDRRLSEQRGQAAVMAQKHADEFALLQHRRIHGNPDTLETS